MDTAEVLELRVHRRLQTDGEAADPRPLVGGDLFRIHRAGVELDGDLRPLRQPIALAQTVHAPDDQFGVDDGGSAAPEIDRVEHAAGQVFCAQLHLLIDALHVSLGKPDLAGIGSKVAVAAFGRTERDVDVNAGHNPLLLRVYVTHSTLHIPAKPAVTGQIDVETAIPRSGRDALRR